MKLLLSLLMLAVFALAASAADIDGTWKGTAETPNGTLERTFVFKTEGAKVTGESTSQMFGKSTINDGKIEGNIVTFTLNVKYQDNDMKVSYKGTIKSSDTMDIVVELPDGGQSFEYKAKKVS